MKTKKLLYADNMCINFTMGTSGFGNFSFSETMISKKKGHHFLAGNKSTSCFQINALYCQLSLFSSSIFKIMMVFTILSFQITVIKSIYWVCDSYTNNYTCYLYVVLHKNPKITSRDLNATTKIARSCKKSQAQRSLEGCVSVAAKPRDNTMTITGQHKLFSHCCGYLWVKNDMSLCASTPSKKRHYTKLQMAGARQLNSHVVARKE